MEQLQSCVPPPPTPTKQPSLGLGWTPRKGVKPQKQGGSKVNCQRRPSLLPSLERAAHQSAVGRGQRAAGKGTQSLLPPTSRPSCDSRWRWSG